MLAENLVPASPLVTAGGVAVVAQAQLGPEGKERLIKKKQELFKQVSCDSCLVGFRSRLLMVLTLPYPRDIHSLRSTTPR